MPLLKPTLSEDAAVFSDGEVLSRPVNEIATPNTNALEVLKAAGIDQRRGKSKMSPLLINEGLGLEECARKLANFAHYSDNEKIQWDSVQLALRLHGELDEKDRQDQGVQIIFAGATPEMMQVLIPR